jgi:1-aminocyclopropane-1-carboxylate deaminase/D-cysteine desulfhydrase-like pyridoxal-dependent ACC family enzyme
MATALASLMALPAVTFAADPSPVAPLTRLAEALGSGCPRLFIKRDDLIGFALGGNKVRKMQTVAAEALAAGADRLITCGGVQSNHARVTAAAGARLGLAVDLVLNGAPPAAATGNTRLDALFGATIHYVPAREDRAPAMEALADRYRAAGGRPFVVPLGASTPTGAIGFARGAGEIAVTNLRPDVIVHATSSAGTQAGLIAGCALFGIRARVLGISADEPADALAEAVRGLLAGIAARLGAKPASVGAGRPFDVDDRVRRADAGVGGGAGTPRPPRGGPARSRVHGQGDGRPHRADSRGRVPPRRDRALLAHGRHAGILCVTGPGCLPWRIGQREVGLSGTGYRPPPIGNQPSPIGIARCPLPAARSMIRRSSDSPICDDPICRAPRSQPPAGRQPMANSR